MNASNGFAIMRVCCGCNVILGAKDEVDGREIPLVELHLWRLAVRDNTTGGMCEGCQQKFLREATSMTGNPVAARPGLPEKEAA